MNSRCFLLAEPRPEMDVTKADVYGKVTRLPVASDVVPPSLFDRAYPKFLIDQLENVRFDPDRDYLIGIGTGLELMVFTTALVSYYGTIQCLAFDMRIKDYRKVLLGEEIEEEILDEHDGKASFTV